jgi:hypothetical protein
METFAFFGNDSRDTTNQKQEGRSWVKITWEMGDIPDTVTLAIQP